MALLPSPPLRTVRASFPAHGSSLSNARDGGRGVTTEAFRFFGLRVQLQSADFALLALLLRLYDSPLQTTHVAVGSLPIDGMPVKGWTQARGEQRVKALLQVLDEFLLLASSSKSLVAKDHAEVSAVARAVRLLFEITQRLSRSLQSGLGLLRDPLPDLPSALLAVSFPELRVSQAEAGLTTFRVPHRIVQVSP